MLRVAILVLSTLLIISTNADLSCDEQLIESDKCMRKLIYIGDWDLKFIRTPQDVNEHCVATKKNFACVRKYNKCLRELPREIFNIFAKNARNLYKDRCEKSSGRAEFLKHALCLDKDSLKINICMDKTLMLLDYVSKNVNGDRDTLLRSVCCAAQLGIDCFRAKISGYCEAKTNANTTAYLSSRVNSMLADVFDLTCTKYRNIQSCDADMPDLMASYRAHIAGEKVSRQSVSLLIPLMKVVKKIRL